MNTTCTATQTVPIGYDETVFAYCDLPHAHAGDHHFITDEN